MKPSVQQEGRKTESTIHNGNKVARHASDVNKVEMQLVDHRLDNASPLLAGRYPASGVYFVDNCP